MKAKANRNYKDTVFTDLFYTDEDAEKHLLSLYNALYGTDYTDPSVIRKIRLEDVLFMNFKNDMAFTVENRKIILSEHQSTVNPNMPLRKLMYVAREYERIVPVRDRYRSHLVQIPTPEFITLYNGVKEAPDEQILRLSDAFAVKEEKTMLELVVRVLNINPGHNEKLKDSCPVLKQYTELVECTRKHEKDRNALEKAVKECIANGILADYLRRKGSEVINMLMAEYDYEMDMEVRSEEARQDGWAEGRAEGRAKGLAEGLAKGLAEGRAEEQKELVRKKLAKGKALETIADELEENDLSLVARLIKEVQSENES